MQIRAAMTRVLACTLGVWMTAMVMPDAVAAAPATTPTPVVAQPSAQSTIERSRAILDTALTARNPDSRKAGVESLGLIGPREPYKTRLMVMLQDQDVEVRVATISSLVDLHDKDTVAAIRRAYDDTVPEVSFAAAKALLALGNDTGREALTDVVMGDDNTASGYVATSGRAVVRVFYAPKSAIPYLMARTIGFAHVAGLGAGVASLEGLLNDPNVSGRASAVLLLGQDKDPKVLPALRHALHDKDVTVRAAAVHAIALRDDTALEPDLLPMLGDKKIEVSARAAAGCLRLELIASESLAATQKPVPAVAPDTRTRSARTR